MSEPIHIQQCAKLSSTQVAEIGELARAVRATGIDPRISLEWLSTRDGSMPTDWLAYQDGRLIGLLSTSTFGGTSEATIALDPAAPAETANTLFTTWLAELPRKEVNRVLLLHDRNAVAIRKVAETHGLILDHSEHAMHRPAESGPLPSITGPLQVRIASDEDLLLVAAVSSRDWGMDADEILANIRKGMVNGGVDYYLATLGTEPVSALNIQWLEGRPWVYGFSVSENYRGRGFGRQTISYALAEALARSPGDAFLEVEPTNTPAVQLYLSLGFAVQRTFDYWAKELVDGTHS